MNEWLPADNSIVVSNDDPLLDCSMDIDDIHLFPGWYLLQRFAEPEEGKAEVETDGKIVLVVNRDDVKEFPNVARVIKVADEGCSGVVEVGDFVAIQNFGGNYHDDKKPQPLVRRWGDKKTQLWVAHETMLQVKIPPRRRDV